MRWLQKLSLRLRAALWRTQVEREMEAELAEHLESETRELMALGVPATEARRRALTVSDTLLMFLLRAHRPALYRERVELRLDIRREAQRIAAELDGVSADEIIAEAERIARDGVRP